MLRTQTFTLGCFAAMTMTLSQAIVLTTGDGDEDINIDLNVAIDQSPACEGKPLSECVDVNYIMTDANGDIIGAGEGAQSDEPLPAPEDPLQGTPISMPNDSVPTGCCLLYGEVDYMGDK